MKIFIFYLIPNIIHFHKKNSHQKFRTLLNIIKMIAKNRKTELGVQATSKKEHDQKPTEESEGRSTEALSETK